MKIKIFNSFINILGRYFALEDAFYFDNVSSGIEFSFFGTKISICTKTLAHERINPLYPMFTVLKVQIDNNESFRLDIKNDLFEDIIIAENLENKNHHVKILKSDDPLISTFVIKSINVDGKLLKTKTHKYKMEVFGDSILSGGDNLIGDGESLDVVPGTGDGTRTYATLAANAIDAQISVFSRCGICLYPASSSDQEIVVSKIYNKCSATNLIDWDMSKFIPDIILIGLGTNDELGDKFLGSNFKKTLINFIKTLTDIYKKNILFIISYGYMDKNIELETAILDTVKELKNSYNICSLKLPKAKKGHPSIHEHEQGGALLEKLLKEKLAI